MLRFMERDRKLVVKCAMCRWLTTAQIQRLYFPGATLNATQKRLRKLAEEGYLRTHREGMLAEALHTAGPKGRVILDEEGFGDFSSEVPKQVSHLAGVNDIRISVETGGIPVAYFFAHWQFACLGWRHPVIPDAVFGLRAPGLRSFAVEFDRATEGLSVLLTKLQAYREKLPGFSFEAVVIVMERERRTDALRRDLKKHGISARVLVAMLAEVRSQGIEHISFLDLKDGAPRKLLDAPPLAGNS